MKRSRRVIAAFLSIMILCMAFSACSQDGTTGTTTTKTDGTTADGGSAATDGTTAGATKFDENVTLYVTAFVGMGEADGRRTDPVSKYIEDALNIKLELTGVKEADYPTQLSAMIASNDLPDIFLFSDVTKQYPMLMESDNLLALEPYLEEYAPNTVSDPNGQVMLEAYRLSATSPDGQDYLWGMCKGTWDDGTLPTCGHYLRWDVYANAGYPELASYDEDLLDVMEAMVAAEPQTAAGEKTYGCGAWFGDGQDWGEWVFTYGLAPQEGANLMPTTGRTLAISTVDSTPINDNQMTDPEGYFWRAVQFYNKANQRGLLDPDSFTQKSDVYEQKMKDGRYMFNVPGWMSSSANAEFNKTEGNQMTFVSLPSISADAEDRFGNMYKGERTYGVSANAKYPERCVALLDFLSTYDFSRIAWNGLEGTNWNVENGEPVPTDDYLVATKDDAFGVLTGASVYHHFCGYGNGTVNPADGFSTDLYQFSTKATEKKTNDTSKDFCDYYKQSNLVDVYKAETTTTKSVNMINFGEAPEDMTSYINGLNAYVGKNVFKVVAAKDDAEFTQLRDEMIAGMSEYHIDEIFQHFYDEAVAQAGDVEKLVTLVNSAD